VEELRKDSLGRLGIASTDRRLRSSAISLAVSSGLRRWFLNSASASAASYHHFRFNQYEFDIAASRAATSIHGGCAGHRKFQHSTYVVSEQD